MYIKMNNAMTVDVEDYYHVSAFADVISINDWDNYESRVERNTRNLLELFLKYNIKSTFFVLGWVAEKNPELIRNIAREGHEIASHGYSHQLIYNQTKEKFREETIRSKNILEDIIQQPVKGYRAASYSITNKSNWALDILAETGFEYDSSIFPVRHDRYGIPDAPKIPHLIKTSSGNTIIEYPLSTINIFSYSLPVAGGGYFRLYPYVITKYALKTINRKNIPFVFYLHPWEVDPEQPKIDASLLSRFRHYNNLRKTESRLKKLLSDFKFDTISNILKQYNFADIDFENTYSF